jgi:hypothetical protein
MKTFGLVLLVSAAGVGAALHAQTPTQTPPTSSSANKVTVTGCIQRAVAEAPTATSGTSGAAIPDTQFVLANATAGTSPTGTSGTSSSAMSTAPRYRLDDDAVSKITPHVGHKVEVTGTVDSASRASGATSTGAAAPKLKVDSIKMMAATCSE